MNRSFNYHPLPGAYMFSLFRVSDHLYASKSIPSSPHPSKQGLCIFSSKSTDNSVLVNRDYFLFTIFSKYHNMVRNNLHSAHAVVFLRAHGNLVRLFSICQQVFPVFDSRMITTTSGRMLLKWFQRSHWEA